MVCGESNGCGGEGGEKAKWEGRRKWVGVGRKRGVEEKTMKLRGWVGVGGGWRGGDLAKNGPENAWSAHLMLEGVWSSDPSTQKKCQSGHGKDSTKQSDECCGLVVGYSLCDCSGCQWGRGWGITGVVVVVVGGDWGVCGPCVEGRPHSGLQWTMCRGWVHGMRGWRCCFGWLWWCVAMNQIQLEEGDAKQGPKKM